MIRIHGDAVSAIDKVGSLYLSLVEASTRLRGKDVSLWGKASETEARTRLAWVDFPTESRKLLPVLDSLWSQFNSYNRIILSAMGGSSLAPQVIAASNNKSLIVLDSTDPNVVKRALDGDLLSTLVIVSSKSGTTIEVLSHLAIFEQALLSAGATPKDHIVIITDAHSPLDEYAKRKSIKAIHAEPNVGGRYSALSAYGLAPSALLGLDISVLLDQAQEAEKIFEGLHSPAVAVAYLLAKQSGHFISITDAGSVMPGLSDWIEQLLAESTGKGGKGILPVVVENLSSPVSGSTLSIAFEGNADLIVEGDLGSQFIFWEWVTALLCYAINVDPFNEPHVALSKTKTTSLLSQWAGSSPSVPSNYVDGDVEVFGSNEKVVTTLSELLSSIHLDDYLYIMAYLDSEMDLQIGELRNILAHRCSSPVAFGWGPRFLHSTGQFHKGGPDMGAFLQITADPEEDIEIPGQAFTLQTLMMAQALGDAEILLGSNRKVIRLHLKNREKGISQILSAARSIS